ncbi:Glyceraldehyde 3-phosphate phosphatase [Candidatus Lokiarchaeum ossiferum]|uniref:Glyceraldehyde 3-phosphate phosphatase n=1 Tax=Candidatus Lokiarchaeum ossiferum TaxID=2951803 RepID=A0ABY6HKF7_9ARCH|nr:Glyceraldehyde 3-phosphate phosphatase [Candidatus Lokiarchaeum sp. B-35]
MTLEAIIFDCDGVLVDSEKFSCGAWNVLMKKEYNLEVGTDYNAILGKNSTDAAKFYLEKYDIDYSKDLLHVLAKKKEDTYYQISKNHLDPVPGIRQIIHDAKSLKLKIAVASSGSLDKINYSLTETGLRDEFDMIICADDVKHAKPSPDIFLTAMAKLNSKPEQSIVIEDSLSGIIAAKASGAYTVAIANTFPRDKLQDADLVIESFADLDLNALFSHFS